jgi:hypothetical protein
MQIHMCACLEPRNDHTYIAVLAAGTMALVVLLASFAPRLQDSASVPAHDIEVLPIKEMFARGIYQHLVETRFDVPSVDVRRGESIAVSFTVEEHYSHVEGKSSTSNDAIILMVWLSISSETLSGAEILTMACAGELPVSKMLCGE